MPQHWPRWGTGVLPFYSCFHFEQERDLKCVRNTTPPLAPVGRARARAAPVWRVACEPWLILILTTRHAPQAALRTPDHARE